MGSKNYDKEYERQKSPYMSKTTETEKSPVNKKFNYSKLSKMPGIKSDISSGFYVKNKPLKSPSTPGSTHSGKYYGNSMYGVKKLISRPQMAQQSSHPGPSVHNLSDPGIYDYRATKASVSALRAETRNNGLDTIHSKGSHMTKAPAPVPLPNSSLAGAGGGLGSLNSSSILGGGGGLSKSGIGLGRHQI